MAPKSPATTVPVTPDGFDVVCTIGHVSFGEGEVSAYEAAFTLIGQHGASGRFSFPSEGGGMIEVSVEDTSEDRRAVVDSDDWRR